MDNYGLYFVIGFFYLAIIGLLIAATWRIYEKAGKAGWAAIVPFYNVIILLEIVGKPLWWIFLWFIPGVNVVFAIWTTNLLSKSFGKDEAFTVGLVLLGIVFYPILGFGSAEYQGPSSAEAQQSKQSES